MGPARARGLGFARKTNASSPLAGTFLQLLLRLPLVCLNPIQRTPSRGQPRFSDPMQSTDVSGSWDQAF